MKDIVICGAGGFAREIACVINAINNKEQKWNFLGFIEADPALKGTSNEYGSIIGNDDELNNWDKPIDVVIGVGSPLLLKKIVEKLTNPNISFPNVISPNTCFLDIENVKFGKGNVIMPNTLISCNVTFGNFNYLNVFGQIGHDACLGNYNIAMPSVNLSGGVIIGDCNMFGVKSTILQYKKVGNNVSLTPSSVLMRNGKDNMTYMGNPAKKITL